MLLVFHIGLGHKLFVLIAASFFHDNLEHECQLNSATRSWTSCFLLIMVVFGPAVRISTNSQGTCCFTPTQLAGIYVDQGLGRWEEIT